MRYLPPGRLTFSSRVIALVSRRLQDLLLYPYSRAVPLSHLTTISIILLPNLPFYRLRDSLENNLDSGDLSNSDKMGEKIELTFKSRDQEAFCQTLDKKYNQTQKR